ncbi:MAG TPA: response regulator transcription factor [Candidatus Angelobacter sp.]|nr:response regulator transcription factor [Candidatus Angelobacter sp.]
MSLGTVVVPTHPAKIAGPVARKRALIVDDSTTILHAICTLLEHHEIVEVTGRAESGQEAIDAVMQLKPELVVMDADMPGMSGLRTALLLSQMAPETRIILLSMDTSQQFRAACAGCGANAVIYKPKFLRELSTLLQRPLRGARFAGLSFSR